MFYEFLASLVIVVIFMISFHHADPFLFGMLGFILNILSFGMLAILHILRDIQELLKEQRRS